MAGAKKPQRNNEYWWEMLLAIPAQRESAAYERLKRVWFDHTWSGHPFMKTGHENHLTATLFENFALFPPGCWVHKFLNTANVGGERRPFLECAWGYEVLADGKKLADVAIHALDAEGDSVIVVESKAPGGMLKATDADPASYLDLEEFRWSARRWLIYLVDESDVLTVQPQINDPLQRTGIITWQALGGLQIELARELGVAEPIRGFVAGAIQYQYLQHGILPTTLAAEYLKMEPPASEISAESPTKMTDWRTAWRLRESASGH